MEMNVMMDRVFRTLTSLLCGLKIKKQLFVIYFITAFLPLLLIGVFLVLNTFQNLNKHYTDLVYAENNKIKAILSELTTQIYTITDDLITDKELSKIISNKYLTNYEFQTQYISYSTINDYNSNYAAIDTIKIYTDNPGIGNYANFHKLNKDVLNSEWYKKVENNYNTYWIALNKKDTLGNDNWNMCLIRKIPIINSDYQAIVCVIVSNEYIKMLTHNSEFNVFLTVEDTIFYSSDRRLYGDKLHIVNNPNEIVLPSNITNGEIDISNIVASKTYMSKSMVYIYTGSKTANKNIRQILIICFFIIFFALVIPAILIYIYNTFFSRRVNILRSEIHKVSLEDFSIIDKFQGDDELSDAFNDVKKMVEKIKKTKLLMYEAKIKEQDMKYQQQVMEFKMLSSQINPHFLYNTLGTLHMKALKSNDNEVADGIIILSQIMRYVLSNTGTTFVTLADEINYLENYLQLQQMRFGINKLNYSIIVDPDFDISSYYILPLLLQPIIENAILHGMDGQKENELIELELNKKEDCIEIIISDNGAGIEKDTLERIRTEMHEDKKVGSSIGIYNTNKRIKLCYGEQYGIKIFSKLENGTSVIIKLPLESTKSTNIKTN